MALYACTNHPLSCPTPWFKGLHASGHVCMSSSPLRSAPLSLHSCAQMCAALCHQVCSRHVHLVPYPGQKVYILHYMYACPPNPQACPLPSHRYIQEHTCPCVCTHVFKPPSKMLPHLHQCICISTCIHTHLPPKAVVLCTWLIRERPHTPAHHI